MVANIRRCPEKKYPWDMINELSLFQRQVTRMNSLEGKGKRDGGEP